MSSPTESTDTKPEEVPSTASLTSDELKLSEDKQMEILMAKRSILKQKLDVIDYSIGRLKRVQLLRQRAEEHQLPAQAVVVNCEYIKFIGMALFIKNLQGTIRVGDVLRIGDSNEENPPCVKIKALRTDTYDIVETDMKPGQEISKDAYLHISAPTVEIKPGMHVHKVTN